MSFKNGLEVVVEVGQSWQSSVGLLGSAIVAINFIRDSVAPSSSSKGDNILSPLINHCVLGWLILFKRNYLVHGEAGFLK